MTRLSKRTAAAVLTLTIVLIAVISTIRDNREIVAEAEQRIPDEDFSQIFDSVIPEETLVPPRETQLGRASQFDQGVAPGNPRSIFTDVDDAIQGNGYSDWNRLLEQESSATEAEANAEAQSEEATEVSHTASGQVVVVHDEGCKDCQKEQKVMAARQARLQEQARGLRESERAYDETAKPNPSPSPPPYVVRVEPLEPVPAPVSTFNETVEKWVFPSPPHTSLRPAPAPHSSSAYAANPHHNLYPEYHPNISYNPNSTMLFAAAGAVVCWWIIIPLLIVLLCCLLSMFYTWYRMLRDEDMMIAVDESPTRRKGEWIIHKVKQDSFSGWQEDTNGSPAITDGDYVTLQAPNFKFFGVDANNEPHAKSPKRELSTIFIVAYSDKEQPVKKLQPLNLVTHSEAFRIELQKDEVKAVALLPASKHDSLSLFLDTDEHGPIKHGSVIRVHAHDSDEHPREPQSRPIYNAENMVVEPGHLVTLASTKRTPTSHTAKEVSDSDDSDDDQQPLKPFSKEHPPPIGTTLISGEPWTYTVQITDFKNPVPAYQERPQVLIENSSDEDEPVPLRPHKRVGPVARTAGVEPVLDEDGNPKVDENGLLVLKPRKRGGGEPHDADLEFVVETDPAGNPVVDEEGQPLLKAVRRRPVSSNAAQSEEVEENDEEEPLMQNFTEIDYTYVQEENDEEEPLMQNFTEIDYTYVQEVDEYGNPLLYAQAVDDKGRPLFDEDQQPLLKPRRRGANKSLHSAVFELEKAEDPICSGDKIAFQAPNRDYIGQKGDSLVVQKPTIDNDEDYFQTIAFEVTGDKDGPIKALDPVSLKGFDDKLVALNDSKPKMLVPVEQVTNDLMFDGKDGEIHNGDLLRIRGPAPRNAVLVPHNDGTVATEPQSSRISATEIAENQLVTVKKLNTTPVKHGDKVVLKGEDGQKLLPRGRRGAPKGRYANTFILETVDGGTLKPGEAINLLALDENGKETGEVIELDAQGRPKLRKGKPGGYALLMNHNDPTDPESPAQKLLTGSRMRRVATNTAVIILNDDSSQSSETDALKLMPTTTRRPNRYIAEKVNNHGDTSVSTRESESEQRLRLSATDYQNDLNEGGEGQVRTSSSTVKTSAFTRQSSRLIADSAGTTSADIRTSQLQALSQAGAQDEGDQNEADAIRFDRAESIRWDKRNDYAGAKQTAQHAASSTSNTSAINSPGIAAPAGTAGAGPAGVAAATSNQLSREGGPVGESPCEEPIIKTPCMGIYARGCCERTT